MALLDQLPALPGVVVGSLGSYAVRSLTERRRWKRQREERWDEKRFETSVPLVGDAATIAAARRRHEAVRTAELLAGGAGGRRHVDQVPSAGECGA
ncbi:hypothetical protein [Streptomyces venetus]|uniref:hypothetical protein n=1 Tax=Streptomyces venetus TaxID=1701086 RepID=UPI0031EBF0F2